MRFGGEGGNWFRIIQTFLIFVIVIVIITAFSDSIFISYQYLPFGWAHIIVYFHLQIKMSNLLYIVMFL